MSSVLLSRKRPLALVARAERLGNSCHQQGGQQQRPTPGNPPPEAPPIVRLLAWRAAEGSRPAAGRSYGERQARRRRHAQGEEGWSQAQPRSGRPSEGRRGRHALRGDGALAAARSGLERNSLKCGRWIGFLRRDGRADLLLPAAYPRVKSRCGWAGAHVGPAAGPPWQGGKKPVELRPGLLFRQPRVLRLPRVARVQVRRLHMYKQRPVRDKKGKVLYEAFQSKTAPNTRIVPDRRWFGNTRVIGASPVGPVFQPPLALLRSLINSFLLLLHIRLLRFARACALELPLTVNPSPRRPEAAGGLPDGDGDQGERQLRRAPQEQEAAPGAPPRRGQGARRGPRSLARSPGTHTRRPRSARASCGMMESLRHLSGVAPRRVCLDRPPPLPLHTRPTPHRCAPPSAHHAPPGQGAPRPDPRHAVVRRDVRRQDAAQAPPRRRRQLRGAPAARAPPPPSPHLPPLPPPPDTPPPRPHTPRSHRRPCRCCRRLRCHPTRAG